MSDPIKLNLLIDDPGNVRSGYHNIDPFTPDGDKHRVNGDITNLDHIVDAAECSEIVAYKILDYVQGQHVDGIVQHWTSKLARNGTLIVSFTDLEVLARRIVDGSIKLEEANQMIHGKQEKPYQFKKSTLTAEIFCEVIKNVFPNFSIQSKRFVNCEAYITIQRNQ